MFCNFLFKKYGQTMNQCFQITLIIEDSWWNRPQMFIVSISIVLLLIVLCSVQMWHSLVTTRDRQCNCWLIFYLCCVHTCTCTSGPDLQPSVCCSLSLRLHVLRWRVVVRGSQLMSPSTWFCATYSYSLPL